MASLGQNQLIGNHQRLADNGIDQVALLAAGGAQRRDQQRMHYAARWRRSSDRRQLLGLQRFDSKIERLLEIGIKTRSRIQVLRVIRGLRNSIALQPVHFSRLMHLLPDTAPLSLNLLPGLAELA